MGNILDYTYTSSTHHSYKDAQAAQPLPRDALAPPMYENSGVLSLNALRHYQQHYLSKISVGEVFEHTIVDSSTHVMQYKRAVAALNAEIHNSLQMGKNVALIQTSEAELPRSVAVDVAKEFEEAKYATYQYSDRTMSRIGVSWDTTTKPSHEALIAQEIDAQAKRLTRHRL